MQFVIDSNLKRHPFAGMPFLLYKMYYKIVDKYPTECIIKYVSKP